MLLFFFQKYQVKGQASTVRSGPTKSPRAGSFRGARPCQRFPCTAGKCAAFTISFYCFPSQSKLGDRNQDDSRALKKGKSLTETRVFMQRVQGEGGCDEGSVIFICRLSVLL